MPDDSRQQPNALQSPKRRRKKLDPAVTPATRIEYVSLAKLMEWPGNPKEHDLEGLGESFERFGFVDPFIFDETTKKIVAGHGRREKLFAWKESGKAPPERVVVRGKDWFVPVLRGVHFKNEHEAEAYLVGNNQLVINGGYNATALAAMLARHKDHATGIGWKVDEIEELCAKAERAAQGVLDEVTAADDEQNDAIEARTHTCPKCGHLVKCND